MHTTIVAPGLRRLALVLWVVAVVLVPLALVGGGSPWLAIVPSLTVAFVGWAALWRPRIELTPEHLRIVDVRRTSTYTWSRITEVRTKYGIEVVTSEGVRRVWIATRPTARLVARSGDQPGGPDHLDVEAAAARVLAHVPAAAVQEGPPPATVVAAPITHRTHGWTILAMVVLGVAASLASARL
ncbi:PH domain-containing protein [Curtobacterium sp. YC1]|uniref:PH domain-containing protein n=1 Tax=Curtobacterium sp. YC1 TaxID=2795488 RepID=UPI0018E577AD|nr:PH domain-containing protein [Curtobacterium sp. YC1]QQD76949.1 PH domain-containing protein [Curtobacterium sp. YC1]